MIGKSLKKNNSNVSLNVLYEKEMEMCSTCISKYNPIREKKIKFLLVPSEQGWHYPAISKLPALLRGITSKSNGGFYCVHCLHYFRTENKL